MGVDEAKLAAYLDGELSEEERERVEEHLAGSPWLRDKLERLRQEADQVNQALDSLSPVSAVFSASQALKRFQSQLSLAPGPNSLADEVYSRDHSQLVWESPSLWAEIRSGLKSVRPRRGQAMQDSIQRKRMTLVAVLILTIPAITVAFILLFNSYIPPLGSVRLRVAQPGQQMLTPPAAGSILPAQRGIQVDPLGDTQANIEHLKALGFGWVKFQMAWKDVEPIQGDYRWARWDEVIGAYAEKGIYVMLSIVKAPDWARPVDDDKNVEGLPADPATYAEFVARVANRYRGQVQAIEVWDEQNMWYKAGGVGRIDAKTYVALLQQAYQAIKAANEDTIVVSGAMAPAVSVTDATNGALALDDIDYLQRMYANGFKGYFDVLGAYAPGNNCPALADWRTFEDESASFRGPVETRHHSWCFLGPLEAYREVMLANGDGDKVIWVTQFGWAVADSPVPGYEYAADNTYKEQAQWIVEAYRWAADHAWIGPMFLWNLDYGLTAPDTPFAYFSILDTPAYDALMEMSRAEEKEK